MPPPLLPASTSRERLLVDKEVGGRANPSKYPSDASGMLFDDHGYKGGDGGASMTVHAPFPWPLHRKVRIIVNKELKRGGGANLYLT